MNIKMYLTIISLVISFAVINIYAESNQKNTKNFYTIVITLSAQSGKSNELYNALQIIQKLSLQESSCLQYEVIQNSINPDQFGLFERWTNQADHAMQFEKDYIKDFIEKMPSLVEQSSMIYIAE